MGPDLEERHERERVFHDRWAREVEEESLDPDRLAACPTIPETHDALARLGNPAGRRILELGCGYGEMSAWLAKAGADLTARDLSPEMVDVARRLTARLGLSGRIRFDVGPGESLDYPDESFDAVFGHDVLHHMDLRAAMGETRRVLRPGGVAVFAEPLGHNPILNRFRTMSPETRTPDERPLRFSDFKSIADGFASFRHKEFQLFTLAIFAWFRFAERLDPNRVRYWKRIIVEGERYRRAFAVLNAMDRALLAILPPAGRLCRMTVLELRK